MEEGVSRPAAAAAAARPARHLLAPSVKWRALRLALVALAVVAAAVATVAVYGRTSDPGGDKAGGAALHPSLTSLEAHDEDVGTDVEAGEGDPVAAGATMSTSSMPAAASGATQAAAFSSSASASSNALNVLQKQVAAAGAAVAEQDGGGFGLGGGQGGQSEEGACYVRNAEELAAAIEEESLGCDTVVLTNFAEGAYVLTREIVISRPVLIRGNSAALPVIDGNDVERAFRVTASGYLDMRYLRLYPGSGILRERIPGVPSSGQVREVRGGTIMFEPGAVGGNFVGCMFLLLENTPEHVEENIEMALENIGQRFYGGHILITGGTLNFVGCLFYEIEYFHPTNDVIFYGDYVLMLAGQAHFSGCVFVQGSFFGYEGTIGGMVALIGGVLTTSFCTVQEFDAMGAEFGAGLQFFVGGGVHIMTGVHMMDTTGMENMQGTGSCTVAGGVMVQTGVSLEDFVPLYSAVGTGFGYTVAAGALISVGTHIGQWNGVTYQNLWGGSLFVGSGQYESHSSPFLQYQAIGGEVGGGGGSYNAGGMSTYISSPHMDFAGIKSNAILGELVGLGGGFMVFLFCPLVQAGGLEYFAGRGGSIFVGGGAALLGYSPLVHTVALHNEHAHWWISGSCEPYSDAWSDGKPFLVTSGLGCYHLEPDFPGVGIKPPRKNTTGWHGHIDERNQTKNGLGDRFRRRLQTTSIRDLAGLGQGGLLMYNNELTPQQLDRVMSPELQAATSALQDRVRDLRALLGRGSEADVEEKIMYIEEAPQGPCSVCGGVDRVEGPGAAGCDVQPTCDLFAKPKDLLFGQQGQQQQQQEKEEEGLLEPPERFLILADLEPTTIAQEDDDAAPSASSDLTATDIEEAVRHALGQSPDLSEQTVEELHSLKVTVFSTEPDAILTDMFPETRRARVLQAADGATFHRSFFKAAIIATSQERADGIVAALQAQQQDTLDEQGAVGQVNIYSGTSTTTSSTGSGGGGIPGGFADRVRSFLAEAKGLEVSDLGLAFDRVLYIPAYNSRRMLEHEYHHQREEPRRLSTREGEKEQPAPLLRHLVTVRDPAQPAVPVTHLEYGRRYSLHLQGFAPHAGVRLRAVGAQDWQGRVLASWPLLPDGDPQKTDADGELKLDYLVSGPEALPPGEFYIEATEAGTGALGLSPLYAVSHRAQPRRLYGPSMWI